MSRRSAALLLLAVWQVPQWLDWNRYRATIEVLASATLGQPVTIDGPITLTLLPQPVLTAAQVNSGGEPAADRVDPCRGTAAARGALAAARRTCRCARTGAARPGPAPPVAGWRRMRWCRARRPGCRGLGADRGRPAHRRAARVHRHRRDAEHRRQTGALSASGTAQLPGATGTSPRGSRARAATARPG